MCQIGEWYISMEHEHCVCTLKLCVTYLTKYLVHQVCYIRNSHSYMQLVAKCFFIYVTTDNIQIAGQKQLCQRGKWIVCVVINCLHTLLTFLFCNFLLLEIIFIAHVTIANVENTSQTHLCHRGKTHIHILHFCCTNCFWYACKKANIKNASQTELCHRGK